MKYLLNDTLYFDDEKRTLKDKSTETQLAVATSKLLAELISSNGQQVSRMTLLENVWDDMGLVASDNNLNRNISLLRKAFQEFDVSVEIETVPKQGYIFHGKVDIISGQDVTISTAVNKKAGLIRCYISMFCALLFITLLYFSIHHSSQDNVDLVKYKNIGSCQVFLNDKKINVKHVDSFFTSPLGLRISENCKTQKKNIYFDDNKIPISNRAYETHVVLCGDEKKEADDECKNYINYNNN
ncbi:winged helix-turn-helix domain-containing protein [Klebsiella sp. R445]